MSDYAELIKALRYCAENGDFKCGKDCPMRTEYPNCLTKMDTDAAAAIEDLQAEKKKTVTQIFGEEQMAWEGRCKALMYQIADLQARLPKRGEWVKGPDGIYHCSVCGATAPYLDAFDGVIQYWENLFYCNRCGAKMEVQE